MTTPPGDWAAFTAGLYAQNQFAIKLGLSAMHRALGIFGAPSHPVILVAGTNGKGTTSCAIAALLQTCGLKVGLYTSPHLIDLTERFRIQGKPATRDQILPLGQAIVAAFGQPSPEGDPALTFFELTTLMAVGLFNQQRVDVGIYEVGLGGRLDATNALEPALSVITTLGFDHQRYLGDTIPAIFAEKLGIARPHVPLLLGAQDYPEVFDYLGDHPHDPPAQIYGDLFDLHHHDHTDAIITPHGTFPIDPSSSAWSQSHQRRHWALGVTAAQTFLGRPLTQAEFGHAFYHSRWPGRFDLRKFVDQTTGKAWNFLLDGAHNPDGSRGLFHTLASHDISPSAILCGAMGDKDLPSLWRPLTLLPWRNLPVYAVEIDSPRAATAHTLRESIPHLVDVGPLPTMMTSLLAQVAPEDGPVLVFGSLYLIGECLAYMGVAAESLSVWVEDKSSTIQNPSPR